MVRVQTTTAMGTGIVVNSEGLVITNEHVVGTARTVALTVHGGGVYSGSVVATDESKDLALIRINERGLALHPLAWGSETSLRPASRILAWGYALDLPGEPTLTTGVFSGLRRLGSVNVDRKSTR
ncbi:MAG: trypsin-like peptidase domain-containing protein, partial [Thermomicrobiales bacterium]